MINEIGGGEGWEFGMESAREGWEEKCCARACLVSLSRDDGMQIHEKTEVLVGLLLHYKPCCCCYCCVVACMEG
jgi:hypothetical protein